MDKIAIKVRVYGRVQGVWYRGWAEETARQLRLDGWVRNRLDGSVEALFVGDSCSVDEMILACHDGPQLAAVERIETRAAQVDAPECFEIRPSA